MNDLLFGDFPISRSPMPEETATHSGLQFFIDYINVLEGLKTKIKNLHWAAKKLSCSNKRGAHLYLDELLDIVAGFQDTVAESSQGILGEMNTSDVQGIPVPTNDPMETVKWALVKTMAFYDTIPVGTEYVGIKSETEVFIKDLTKYKYLFNLTV